MDEPVSQAPGQLALSYPLPRTFNMKADNNTFGELWKMEYQSVPGTIHVDRSTLAPSRIFVDHDGLTAWRVPDPPTSASGRSNYASLGVLSETPGDLPACRSVSKVPYPFFDSSNNVAPSRSRGPQKMGRRHRTQDRLAS